MKSIKHKLMLFVTLLCGVIIGIVWLLNVVLLEPTYYRTIVKELRHTAAQAYAIIEKDSLFTAQTQSSLYSIGSIGTCIDISYADTLQCVMSVEGIGDSCRMHPYTRSILFSHPTRETNSATALAARTNILNTKVGEISTLTIPGNGSQQLLAGTQTPNGYIIIVSQNLERISQAVDVLKRQLALVSAIVIVIALLAGYWFSGWFSRPLSSLSNAAREIATGNYRVRVDIDQQDEIGILAQDFNFMAEQVCKTDNLQKELMANISHDLRTPLTLIKGYAETIRDLNGENPVKRQEQLNIIVDETDRLSGLVNSVMELSKLSSGAEKPVLVSFDISEMCEEIGYRYQGICESHGYRLQFETVGERYVNADPNLISRVMYNLLGNALNHIGEDGRLILRLTDTKEGSVRIEVTDHGCGIDTADLPYIFDRYFRSRADSGKIGTGLGLSIVKAILVGHGCPFGVTSTVGEGSTFWFEISCST
ncbi:MAG: HAMP domain-containing sensor histidine kinase [Oscillospiraceae bacterium]|nr:HAMP domain-containing sensor histidine kinase [Oscillospiraceae bacterium]